MTKNLPHSGKPADFLTLPVNADFQIVEFFLQLLIFPGVCLSAAEPVQLYVPDLR